MNKQNIAELIIIFLVKTFCQLKNNVKYIVIYINNIKHMKTIKYEKKSGLNFLHYKEEYFKYGLHLLL